MQIVIDLSIEVKGGSRLLLHKEWQVACLLCSNMTTMCLEYTDYSILRLKKHLLKRELRGQNQFSVIGRYFSQGLVFHSSDIFHSSQVYPIVYCFRRYHYMDSAIISFCAMVEISATALSGDIILISPANLNTQL